MPLPEKYRYLEEQAPSKPSKRDAKQIRKEADNFSTMLKIAGFILFVLFIIAMAALIYYVSGLSENTV